MTKDEAFMQEARLAFGITKEWQDLTDDEMEKIMQYINMPVKFCGGIKSFARAIEAKLKEKNE
jgi:hypothetical protein